MWGRGGEGGCVLVEGVCVGAYMDRGGVWVCVGRGTGCVGVGVRGEGEVEGRGCVGVGIKGRGGGGGRVEAGQRNRTGSRGVGNATRKERQRLSRTYRHRHTHTHACAHRHNTRRNAREKYTNVHKHHMDQRTGCGWARTVGRAAQRTALRVDAALPGSSGGRCPTAASTT